MRLNERPLIFKDEDLYKRAAEMQAKGNKSFCPVVFLETCDGKMTWRGVGQRNPAGSIPIATGRVFCPNDGLGRYPVTVFFDEVIEPAAASYFLTTWAADWFLEDHDVVINEAPLACWFLRR